MRFRSPSFRFFLLLSVLSIPGTVLAQTWEPYTGAENLRGPMSDTAVEGEPKEGVSSTGRYMFARTCQ